jgi:uncharacterized protein (TIGR01777 family)
VAKLHIVITGGGGQIGQILARHFHARAHEVIVLSRHPDTKPWRTALWDPRSVGSWSRELDRADLVINLAGRSVNCRYTPANRREIKESRVQSTRILGDAIARATHPPTLWINASTATIYRHAFDCAMDEHAGELGGNEPGAPSTWNFSIDVARSWEQAFFQSSTPETRKVAIRSAMVMSPDRGGVFDTLLTLVRFGLGGTSGSGQQYVSWVHDVDFLSAIEFLVAHPELQGVVNISSPEPLPNCEFMRALRRAWGAPIGLAASRWMLEIGAVFLRTETELILKSRRVVPTRLLEAGFEFRFLKWPEAARDLVSRWRESS